MSHAAALGRNTYIQFAARALGTALGVVAIAVVTRTLGPAGFGGYTTVTSFLQVFGVLVDFGLTIVGLQLLSEPQADERKVVGNLLSLRLVTAVVFLGIAPIAALFFPYSAAVKTGILFTTLSFAALALHQILTAFFQRRLQMKFAALSEVAGRVTLLGLVLLAATTGTGLFGMLAATTAANVVQLVVAWIAAGRLIPIRLQADLALWRRMLSLSWPIGLSIAFNLIYLRADAVILSLSRGQEELGLYGAAYRVIDVLTVVPFLFMGLVLPQLVSSWKGGDAARFSHLLQRSARFLLAMIAPIAAGGVVVGGAVMTAVSGASFAPSGGYLAVLLFGVAMIYWGTVFSHAIVALGLQRRMLPLYAADAVVSLALYVLLVPRFGATAAAWITVLSEAIIAVAAATVVLRHARLRFSAGSPLRIALAAALMALVLHLLLGILPLPLIVSLPLGAALYALFLFLLRALTPDDLRALVAPFTRGKPLVS